MLADKTEPEIFSLMRDRLRSCISDCRLLAMLPLQGPTFIRLRANLKEIEELCRQAGYYRDDARWFRIGLVWEQVHQQSRFWIRHHHPRKNFLWLSERCEALDKAVDDLQARATGRLGMILPKPAREIRTQDRPTQVLVP
jgi:hypothetical protein